VTWRSVDDQMPTTWLAVSTSAIGSCSAIVCTA
jgi:hypothetical protein